MQEDNKTKVVKNDDLILVLCKLLTSGLGHKQSNYISQKVHLPRTSIQKGTTTIENWLGS